VTLGEDGQDVIRLLINEGHVFDMLLVDENMRHMNGSTAARALRKHELKNGMPPMPVFATTGNSAPHDLARYYGCGLDGMFTKPMNMREIVGTLHAYARYRREHYTPQQPVRTYGMALMSPPRTDELGDGIEVSTTTA
jgi:CheY-like chemotaxis protein